MKTPDGRLAHEQYLCVYHKVKLMLEKAGAFGCLPIPVLDVISSANIAVVMEDAVGDSLLFLICI